ncbi:unnamed protein product [Arabidopsis thaliana]|nr:unnamed protein product [Arabidopsis thaliana]
MAAKMYI